MILKPEHEAKLQPEDTDNLGYKKEEFDYGGIEMQSLPPADLGFVSETLHTQLEQEPVKFNGLGNKYPDPIDVQVEMEGTFISAYVLVDGHNTGTRAGIAVQGDDGRFRYQNKFKEILENPATPKESWYRQVHNYLRV